MLFSKHNLSAILSKFLDLVFTAFHLFEGQLLFGAPTDIAEMETMGWAMDLTYNFNILTIKPAFIPILQISS